MNTSLPKALVVGGRSVPIRSDFRAVLDICAALNDPDLTDRDRSEVAVKIFYPRWWELTDYREAVERLLWFLSAGMEQEERKRAPKLMDWEHDFPMLVAPVNRVAGRDVRSLPYLHWWTFVGYYMEIGDCTFSTIISIRRKQQQHKPLEKWEKEFYSENREIVDLPAARFTADEDDFMKKLFGGGPSG